MAHISLVMILVGALVGGTWGFKNDEFAVPVGLHRPGRATGPGLSVKATSFNDSYYESGAPSDYAADLVVYKDGQQVARADGPREPAARRYGDVTLLPVVLRRRDGHDRRRTRRAATLFPQGVPLLFTAERRHRARRPVPPAGAGPHGRRRQPGVRARSSPRSGPAGPGRGLQDGRRRPARRHRRSSTQGKPVEIGGPDRHLRPGAASTPASWSDKDPGVAARLRRGACSSSSGCSSSSSSPAAASGPGSSRAQPAARSAWEPPLATMPRSDPTSRRSSARCSLP